MNPSVADICARGIEGYDVSRKTRVRIMSMPTLVFRGKRSLTPLEPVAPPTEDPVFLQDSPPPGGVAPPPVYPLLSLPAGGLPQGTGQPPAPRTRVAALATIIALALFFLAVVVMAFLMRPTSSKAESAPNIPSVLYRWLANQPPIPPTACDEFEPPRSCQQQLVSKAETFQDRFAGFVKGCMDEQPHVVWPRKGADFPKYNATTREFIFPFQLEGPVQGNAATCIPLRIITDMPDGIAAGVWPDEGSTGTPKKPFSDPCLRTPSWTARLKVDGGEAKRWSETAKKEGWRLEMFFRLAKWQSPLRETWAGDAHLGGEDFVKECLIHLVVDEVRLVVGNEIIHVWR